MATPKVFVSSTCFDLKEVRDSISRFIKSFGFDPVLSEHGDVFYHLDLHTHESCIHEISNCQLFVLIIGGRFGGTYDIDKTKSITNAEYDAARELNIPVFTYIKKGVYDNHHTFQANKNKTFIQDMEFPNIEKKENAINIFNFIDQVRKSKTNNAFETFETANEIEIHLRKQWAGMFFEYLKNRELKEQVNAANIMLSTLKTSNEKLQEMVKILYTPEQQKEPLNSIEYKYNAIEFFELVLKSPSNENKNYLAEESKLDELTKIDPNTYSWTDYLIKLGAFRLFKTTYNKDLEFIGIGKHDWLIEIDDKLNRKEVEKILKIYSEKFENGIKKLSEEERKQILEKFVK